MPAQLVTSIADIDSENRALIAAVVAATPFAFTTDVDGTIAPIAPTPEGAHVMAEVVPLLEFAQQRFAITAAISGRSVAALWSMVHVPGLLYIGDHGNDMWQSQPDTVTAPPPPVLNPQVAEALALLAASPQLPPGLRFEPKGMTASIHFRNTPDPAATLAALLSAMEPITVATGTLIGMGKSVIEVKSPLSRSKGDAIRYLVTKRDIRGIVYIGDDRTDIDAFQAANELQAAGQCQSFMVGVAQQGEAPPDLVLHTHILLADISLVPEFIDWLFAQTPAYQE